MTNPCDRRRGDHLDEQLKTVSVVIGGLRIAEPMIGRLFRILREGGRHPIKQPQEPQVLRCPRLEAWSVPLGKVNFGSAFMLELKQALSILLKLVLGNRLVGPVTSIRSVLRVRRRFETSAYRR